MDIHQKRREEWKQECIVKWKKTEKITQKEGFENFNCLYVDNMDRYIWNEDDLEETIDDYMVDYETCDLSDLRIYGTIERTIDIDACDVVANACEDLHEDAYDNCNIDSLQKVIDEWCEKQRGAKTYYPDYKTGIVLERRNYRSENNK